MTGDPDVDAALALLVPLLSAGPTSSVLPAAAGDAQVLGAVHAALEQRLGAAAW